LVTEGDTIEEAMENVHDAFEATIEAYQHLARNFETSPRGTIRAIKNEELRV
jgi:predicted RNase H-like HicB family nuclease